MKQPRPGEARAPLDASRLGWALIAAVLLGVLGCARVTGVVRDAAWWLNPFGKDSVYVDSTRVLGPYLLAALRSERTNLVLLFPRSENCAELLRPEEKVTYARRGSFGRIERGGRLCEPLGVASLAAWRDRKPRARQDGPLPRATARFSVIHGEDDLVLVRGRFPLAHLVQIPSGFDLVALIPNTPECQPVLERGEASLVFRPVGPDPYRLMVPKGECPVLGLALPPSPSTGREPE